MLVLSRYKDQSIYIGDDIIITVVDVRGDRIRLGIEAPNNVPIHREEIYEAIQREKQEGTPREPSENQGQVEPRRRFRDDVLEFSLQ
ncbi:MAG: carbon storage regulator CsrA [Planctomycetia bacterium]|nr:carbon storage regulator CsrA [Planctomycetia bacterium]